MLIILIIIHIFSIGNFFRFVYNMEMHFLSKSNLLKNDSVLLFVNIYSDKISTFVVERKKEGNAISILASAVEPQEGEIKQGGEPDADKILLNLNKVLQALPLEIMRVAKRAVFGFGADISDFKFRQMKIERHDKDKKITKEELESLTVNKQNEELSTERFIIDGFVVSDPIGLNGKELIADAISMSFSEKLIAGIENLSAGRGMELLGFVNLTQSALEELKNSENSSVGKDFIFVSVFQNNTDVIVIRDNVINSIGNLGAGYGIIEKSVSEKFGVGIEEAKDIIRKMRSGELNGESDDGNPRTQRTEPRLGKSLAGLRFVRQSQSSWTKREQSPYDGNPRTQRTEQSPYDGAKLAVQHALAAYIEKLRELFGNIDKMLILPGTIIIGISEESPELLKVLLDKIWLADLPLERNAAINDLNVLIGGQEKLNSVFDSAILKFTI